MKVFAYPASYSCHKVFWALAELGLSFEYKLVDVLQGEQKQPHITQMNPNQGIPIFEDEGFILYESAAILLYLAERHGKLLPSDPQLRALVHQWLFWETSQLGSVMVKPWLQRFGESLGAPFDQAAHAAACEATRRPLAILDQQLQGRRFVVGDTFSVADIALGETIYMHEFAKIPLDSFPAIQAWFDGLRGRPAFLASRKENIS